MHLESGFDGFCRIKKRGHDGISNGFDQSTVASRDRLTQQIEVPADQSVSRRLADLLVKAR